MKTVNNNEAGMSFNIDEYKRNETAMALLVGLDMLRESLLQNPPPVKIKTN